MKSKTYLQVDLHSIGRAMIEASRYEQMYHEMEADRDHWRDKFDKLLHQGMEHNNHMNYNLLELIVDMGSKTK